VYAEALGVDGIGRISSRTETGLVSATTTYTYDGAGHIQTATRDGVTTTYTYDANGNRLSDGVGTMTYSDGANEKDDRLLTRTVAGATTSYTYDTEGRLASKSGAVTATYTHHDLGPISKVITNGVTVDYTLDASGRRAARTQSGVVTRYVYAGGLHPVAELNANYSVNRVFLYTSHSHVPDFVAVSTGGSSWSLWRVITDHLGSVIGLTDAFGNPIFTRTYDAFGNIVAVTGSTAESDRFIFGFAGGLWDPTTKLVQFGARTYDPEIGRWLERDPSLHKGGVNLYEYAEGDPINRIDPTGHAWYLQVQGGAEAGVGYGAALEGALGVIVENGVGTLFATLGVSPYVVGASAGIGFQFGWATSKDDFEGAGIEYAFSAAIFNGSLTTSEDGSRITSCGIGLNVGPGASGHMARTQTEYPFSSSTNVSDYPQAK
jgi:RHS repeat-associated protein